MASVIKICMVRKETVLHKADIILPRIEVYSHKSSEIQILKCSCGL